MFHRILVPFDLVARDSQQVAGTHRQARGDHGISQAMRHEQGRHARSTRLKKLGELVLGRWE